MHVIPTTPATAAPPDYPPQPAGASAYGPGACYRGGTTTFSVWAPDVAKVELVLENGVEPRPTAHVRRLTRDERGYWSARFDDLRPGTLYRYRLNGSSDQTFPDPASRFQPQGVHGPSAIVDPGMYKWRDAAWRPPRLERLVFYEVHVGTFSPEGTFAGAAARLPYLADLGVTAIEIMPIADFPGARNWGYDGVALFAPARCYGTPDDLRALVDRAHHYGVAVFLDVVYNHFGPDAAYAPVFSTHFLSERRSNPWGRAINFNGPHSTEVRRFFIDNALHWIDEYHIDGLRLDATHAIIDEGPRHFLAELTTTVRSIAGDHVLFIAEDHRNLARLTEPVRDGGYGLDAVWADDLHHQIRVHTAGERDGYYADFSGSIGDIAATLTEGWFYRGQMSSHQDEPRGTAADRLSPPQFVICLQNHDQVGNRADGARLHHQIDHAAYRAASVLLLLAPHTPLLFMGQEWATSAPFLFFTDHDEPLGQTVRAGRRAEFAAFAEFKEHPERVPDPQARVTFERSRLRWDERSTGTHATMERLYRRVLALRAGHIALQDRRREGYRVRALDAHTLELARVAQDGCCAVLLIVRLSGSGTVAVPHLGLRNRRILLTSEDEDVTCDPMPIAVKAGTVAFTRPGAVVFEQAGPSDT